MMPTKERVRITKVCDGDSRTHQSMADACDINLVVARYANGGVVDHVNKSQPKYGDFTNVKTYLEAHTAVQEAHDGFMELPSGVRKVCQNDPGVFLDMTETEEGREALEQAGLKDEQLPAVEDKAVPEAKAEEGGDGAGGA